MSWGFMLDVEYCGLLQFVVDLILLIEVGHELLRTRWNVRDL